MQITEPGTSQSLGALQVLIKAQNPWSLELMLINLILQRLRLCFPARSCLWTQKWLHARSPTGRVLPLGCGESDMGGGWGTPDAVTLVTSLAPTWFTVSISVTDIERILPLAFKKHSFISVQVTYHTLQC